MIKLPQPSLVVRQLVLAAIVPLFPILSRADSITAALALNQVEQYTGSWSSPPTDTSGGETTDGPLLGNGNVGVIVFGGISAMSFHIDKNEYWSLADGSKFNMADMNLAVSNMSSASYSVQQLLTTAQVTGTFTESGDTVKTTSWVQATDTTNNLFITQIAYSGSGSQTATVSFAPGEGNSFPNDYGTSGNVVYFDIDGDSSSTYDGYTTCQVRIAATVIGASPSISNNQLTFTMEPGNTYTVVACVMSNYDSSSWQSLAISNISSLSASSISTDLANHEAWWQSFWGKSYAILSNQTIEKEYYGSLYMLASASAPGHMPPGLWGPWTIGGSNGEPAWNGDDHLNYDYEVPYLGALTANHAELLGSYATPILNYISAGENNATAAGFKGVYYPTGIGPLPYSTSNPGYNNQKTDSVYAAQPIIAYYNATLNTAYANNVLPYMVDVGTFWTNYLTWNGSSYDDTDDAQQEGDAYPQTDGTMSLGLIHYYFQGAIAMANATGTDSSDVSTWTTYNNELAPYPTFTYNSVTCFRETSVGRSWNDGNDCECQMIYPADQVGLLSSSSLLSTAFNTVTQYGDQGAWSDGNATPTFYPMAARVGISASTIISNLNTWINNQANNNLAIRSNGGGMENCNTVPASINEMMMQSFQGTILLFPDWVSGSNAKFGDLLANGNFLISSAYQNSAVQYIRIISQSGGTVTFQNPWSGQTLALYKNGVSDGTLSGTDISISTAVDDVDLIAVNGTSYSSIITEMETLPSGTVVTPSGAAAISGLAGSSCNVADVLAMDGAPFSGAGADGGGHSLSLSSLGSTLVWNGLQYNLLAPNSTNGASNTTVTLPSGQFSTLSLLAIAVNGNQTSQTFTVKYTNGTSTNFTQSMTDWGATPAGYTGESTAATMGYRDVNNGTTQSGTYYLHGYSFAINNSLTVSSIVLPDNANVVVVAIDLSGGSGGSASGPFTVQAASYNSENSVQTEANSENGGLDVGYISNGSYTVYNQISLTGVTTFDARVASDGSGGDIQVRLDSATGTVVGTCTVPVTGGWETWTTVTCNVTATTGFHNIYLVYTGGTGNLFNIEWFSLTGANTQIAASSYNSDSNVETESNSENGALDVGFIENGSWTAYNSVQMSGVTSFAARVASDGAGGTIQVRLGSATGTLIGTCTVPDTGGWQTWVTETCPITATSGSQNIYLVYAGGSGYLFNIEWLSFQQGTLFGLTEAASYNSENSVQTESNSESGGLDVGYISNGSYTVYNEVNLNGVISFDARVASDGAGGDIQVRLDSPTGTVVGTCTVPVTGGWQTWVTETCSVTPTTGCHNIYLVYTGGSGNLFNIEWFTFNASNGTW